MKQISVKLLIVALALVAGVTTVNAGPIVFQASDTIGVNVFQQTNNNPCVIGDASCKEPAGMTYNQWSGTPNAQGSSYDLFSPVYVAAAGVNPFNFNNQTIPTAFTIGVDENISAGASNEILNYFKVWDCTGPVTAGTSHPGGGNNSNVAQCTTVDVANSFTTMTTIPNENNGNGFSDYILTGFSLTAGHFYEFEVNISNDTDGMEEYFIIPTGSPAATPEPGTLVMFGTGLIGLASILRRRLAR